jgi:hypothetical protein
MRALHLEVAFDVLDESTGLVKVDGALVVLVEELYLPVGKFNSLVLDHCYDFVCCLVLVLLRFLLALLNHQSYFDVVGRLGDQVQGTNGSNQDLFVHKPVQVERALHMVFNLARVYLNSYLASGQNVFKQFGHVHDALVEVRVSFSLRCLDLKHSEAGQFVV